MDYLRKEIVKKELLHFTQEELAILHQLFLVKSDDELAGALVLFINAQSEGTITYSLIVNAIEVRISKVQKRLRVHQENVQKKAMNN